MDTRHEEIQGTNNQTKQTFLVCSYLDQTHSFDWCIKKIYYVFSIDRRATYIIISFMLFCTILCFCALFVVYKKLQGLDGGPVFVYLV